jgi:maltose alpha-D-glucosyltransferase/alpha-amylase
MSDDERLWYKDAVFYELRIRSFFDSDGNGIGDLRGLAEKLDYLQDLGVTALWLLPFYPSPLRDDGYDIADYESVHPDYGSLRDFRNFLREAHRRGLRVVTELVLNHTSDQHPWFQRARRSPPGNRYRDFYVWSDTPTRYADARIIFKDFEHSNWSWDPVAGAYFWHRFYANQPDLNFDNPDVRRAVTQTMDFWLEMGVDGLRLDAVPYLFEREGTSCENLPETHKFLKELRAHIDKEFPNRMLLAEANQWPEDAVTYFGQGDECHAAFHFPIMPRLFMAIEMEDRHPIIDILDQTPAIPETCQWVLFLRNHDELTLEMVTDEERDYMVRAYAADPHARINLGIRRRLAPLLGNNRRKIELMNALLFSLPGTPVIYYGDEIGMGDNIYLGDRNGVRTPMQWSPDRNAGFSDVNPQRLVLPIVVDPEYHYEAINVETLQGNPNSLLWWTKRIVDLRKQHHAFGRGTLQPLTPRNRKVLAFYRRAGDETLLIVANLSRFPQYVELDLREFAGRVPRELFGHIEFPPIGQLPYLLTLGPYGFYWFELAHSETRPAPEMADGGELPTVEVIGSWDAIFDAPARDALDAVLARYVRGRRWFPQQSASHHRRRHRRQRRARRECARRAAARRVFRGRGGNVRGSSRVRQRARLPGAAAHAPARAQRCARRRQRGRGRRRAHRRRRRSAHG